MESKIMADMGEIVRYTTYENRYNPHITIHSLGCNQLRKNGGVGRGEYHDFENFNDALNYAKGTGLPVRKCSFCNPR
jgi:hypothetical protein